MASRERSICGLLLALWLPACQSPGSARIIGPDGSKMAHVHCGADQGQCFRIAGELCPGGYDMQPVLRTSDGNFLVRCRAARVAESCPAPAPTFAPTTPPYTASGTTTVTNPRPPLTNQPGAPEIDLGY